MSKQVLIKASSDWASWLIAFWCKPWPMNSQPASRMASAARGYAWITPALKLVDAGSPRLWMASMMRGKPARMP